MLAPEEPPQIGDLLVKTVRKSRIRVTVSPLKHRHHQVLANFVQPDVSK